MRRIAWVVAGVILVAGFLFTNSAGAAPPGRLVYWVQVDIVRGAESPVGPVCVQSGVFKQGEMVVWRANVLESSTGRQPGNEGKGIAQIDELGMKVTVYLENNQSIPMKYGKHPPRAREEDPVRWFWTGSWTIPMDYPTGTLRWWMVITDKKGGFVRYDPIGAGTSLPAAKVIIEKR